MNEIGTYHNRRVVWIEYSNLLKGIMPKDNWVCLATSSSVKPDLDNFDKFTRKAIQNGLLEFKGCYNGGHGESHRYRHHDHLAQKAILY